MNLSEKGLLPCPFCGNADKPSVFRFEGEPYVPGFEVRCDASGWDGQDGKGCGSASGWSETTAEAIAAWNRRAYLQAAGSEEWRDISTCPKNGSHFLARQVVIADEYYEDNLIRKNVREEFTVVAYWAFGSVVQYPWNGGIPSNVSYILWRPLPSPPQEPRHD